TLREALADPRQWSLNFAWLLLGGLALMLSVHVVPFARDQGINLAGASLTLTAYGLGSAAGRLAGGAAADWLGALATTRAAYLIQALALVVLLWSPSRELLLASLVAFGVGFAAGDTIIAKVIPDVFGMRAIGAIMGVLTLGWRCGAALGPAAAGFLYDATGGPGDRRAAARHHAQAGPLRRQHALPLGPLARQRGVPGRLSPRGDRHQPAHARGHAEEGAQAHPGPRPSGAGGDREAGSGPRRGALGGGARAARGESAAGPVVPGGGQGAPTRAPDDRLRADAEALPA